jgi:YesN/AraC family two-component response regulator
MNLSATPVTVVLVEDDARIRRVLSAILDNSQNSRCVGQYDSGEEAVSAIPELSPHVIIMDINLPGINGVECVRQLVV